jgi:hypothetical protein
MFCAKLKKITIETFEALKRMYGEEYSLEQVDQKAQKVRSKNYW